MSFSSPVRVGQVGVVVAGDLAGLEVVVEGHEGERLVTRIDGLEGIFLVIDATLVELNDES